MAALTWRSRGWASVAVAVQWIGGSRSPGDLHRNPPREGVSQGAGQPKRSQRRARGRADGANGLIAAAHPKHPCKPETKGAPRRSKDTPGKGSCDRERYPWFVAQFWTESRNRWRCRFRAADPRPRRGSAGVSRYYGAFARRAPGLA